MKLKDVVLTSAMYLGRDDIINYVENQNDNNVSEEVLSLTDTLTRCANVVINELSSTYIPMYKEETVTVENNKIEYADLEETATEITEVFDEYGNGVHFVIHPEYIEVYEQRVKVRYRYLPSNYGLNDEIGFAEKDIPSRIIAYGVSAEVCLIERGFQESLMWRNRYVDALCKFVMPKNGKIKARRFY